MKTTPRQPIADWPDAETAAADELAGKQLSSVDTGTPEAATSTKHMHTPLLQGEGKRDAQQSLHYVDYSARAPKTPPAKDQAKSWKRVYLNLALFLLLLVGGYLCYLALTRWYA